MASKVDIANAALILYGEAVISSLTEDNEAAITMNLRFDSIRDAVLRAHPWNFAVKRQKLSKLATAPAFGFSNAYQLPSDFLRLLNFNNLTQDHYRMENHEGSRAILTDSGDANLRYIFRITDTTKYDALFVECLAARLAADTVFKITNADATNLEKKLWGRYTDKKEEARSIDGQEDPATILEVDDFVDARVGAGRFRPIESP